MALRESVAVHKALAHPARQRIVAMLQGGPLCVCQLTAALALATSTVSAHLAELKRAGLLGETKDGRWVSYSWSADAEARGILEEVSVRVAADPQVRADVRLARQLRRVGVEELCRMDLDLSRVGLRRPGAAAGR